MPVIVIMMVQRLEFDEIELAEAAQATGGSLLDGSSSVPPCHLWWRKVR
jgi:hypothetical protein